MFEDFDENDLGSYLEKHRKVNLHGLQKSSNAQEFADQSIPKAEQDELLKGYNGGDIAEYLSKKRGERMLGAPILKYGKAFVKNMEVPQEGVFSEFKDGEQLDVPGILKSKQEEIFGGSSVEKLWGKEQAETEVLTKTLTLYSKYVKGKEGLTQEMLKSSILESGCDEEAAETLSKSLWKIKELDLPNEDTSTEEE